jgi:hypothetical protein
MRAIIILLLATTAAAAQKQDRLPDAADTPKVVRVIPITPTFEQRWFGPAAADRWLSNQPPPSDRFTQQNAPSALPEAVGIVPVPGNRLRHEPIVSQRVASIRKPDQATCLRHKLRTVWTGQSWRCRR